MEPGNRPMKESHTEIPAPPAGWKVSANASGPTRLSRASQVAPLTASGGRVRGDPDAVSGQIGRIGEEQESAGGERRVQDVETAAPEDLLAHHHAEADAQRHLPERHGGREDEREEHPGDQKPLAHLVAPDRREEHFPGAADGKGDDQDRQVPEPAVDHGSEHAVRRKPDAEGLDDACPPPRKGRGPLGDGEVRLEAGVVEGHRHGAGEGRHYREHEPLHVEAVAGVRRPGRGLPGGVEEGVLGVPERPEAMERASRLERRPEAIEERAEHRGLAACGGTRVSAESGEAPG